MSAVTTTSPALPPPPWTAADLDHFPDDGLRYELIDGALLVSPAPIPRHQDAVGQLHLLLHAALPPDLKVYLAPTDVRLSPVRLLQPDLIVVRRSDMTPRRLAGLPLLAVEVLSPGTRAVDLTLKRLALEQAGVTSYWLVDADEPSLTVLELTAGAYTETARVTGDQAYDAVLPYPVRIIPSALRDE